VEYGDAEGGIDVVHSCSAGWRGCSG
jgi:hypothetical protein